MALEDAIKDLKESIANDDNAGLLSIYRDRLEKLDNHLAVITYVN